MHDPIHRMHVPYASPQIAARFRGSSMGSWNSFRAGTGSRIAAAPYTNRSAAPFVGRTGEQGYRNMAPRPRYQTSQQYRSMAPQQRYQAPPQYRAAAHISAPRFSRGGNFGSSNSFKTSRGASGSRNFGHSSASTGRHGSGGSGGHRR
jgi:hypothetical protein